MYKRLMLKISGEVFLAEDGDCFDFEKFDAVAGAISDLVNKGIQVAVVTGAGNIWRYRDNKKSDLDRVKSDKLGMLATNFNAEVLKKSLEEKGVKARAVTAFYSENFDAYDVDSAREDLENGEVVICAGGTGNPYFTTDSAAALRALELNCDVVFKATKVDGVYSDDPVKNPDAKRYDELTYDRALAENLKVMDLTAVALCRDNDLPVLVFDFTDPGNLDKVFQNPELGTLIS